MMLDSVVSDKNKVLLEKKGIDKKRIGPKPLLTLSKFILLLTFF